MPDARHYLGPADIEAGERSALLRRAIELKRGSRRPPPPSPLRVGALYFDPSLRTRVSFEQAVWLLGGNCQTLDAGAGTWKLELDPAAVMDADKAENVVEAARVLGRYFHLLGVRAFPTGLDWAKERREPVLRALADHAGIPVISLEGALHHPCQSLADLLTLHEQFAGGRTDEDALRGLPVALCWAWHPRALPAAVPHSFLLQSALAGCDVSVVHPPGYDLDPEVVEQSRSAADAGGGTLAIHHDRTAGLAGREVLYVKSWGPLVASAARASVDREEWLVDRRTMELTGGARLMHCLPVRRNVVISGQLLDGPSSLVTDQAENRLWAQGALVEMLARAQGVLS